MIRPFIWYNNIDVKGGQHAKMLSLTMLSCYIKKTKSTCLWQTKCLFISNDEQKLYLTRWGWTHRASILLCAVGTLTSTHWGIVLWKNTYYIHACIVFCIFSITSHTECLDFYSWLSLCAALETTFSSCAALAVMNGRVTFPITIAFSLSSRILCIPAALSRCVWLQKESPMIIKVKQLDPASRSPGDLISIDNCLRLIWLMPLSSAALLRTWQGFRLLLPST